MERYVYYVDIGNLPATKVKEHIDQIKNDTKDFFGENTKVLYVAINGDSRIEKLQ
jgi:hypothetical protein